MSSTQYHSQLSATSNMECFLRNILLFVTISVLGSTEAIIGQYNECGDMDYGYELNRATGQCYKLHRGCATWTRARTLCQAEGAHLAVVNSVDEAAVLQSLLFRNPPDTIACKFQYAAFIGFYKAHNSKWTTIFNQSLQEAGYARWSPEEPNNAHGDENCGSFGRDGMLFDDPCTRSMPYICRKKAITQESFQE